MVETKMPCHAMTIPKLYKYFQLDVLSCKENYPKDEEMCKQNKGKVSL